MSATMRTAGARPMAGLPAGLVTLLALAVFINYVDRGNFATAAPLMKDALRLSNTQIGIVISAFFWIYAPGQLFAAWAADRWSPYRVLAVGLGLWSLATALTSLAGGFAMLLSLRVLLGVGECVAFPCSSQLLARHLPSHSLGAANSLIAVGLALGPAAGTLAGGVILVHWGWRASFAIFGLASLAWLWPWLAVTGRAWSTKEAICRTSAEPSFGKVLTRRAVWAAGLGQFCGNFAVYFVISWAPLFLVKHRGFTVPQMAGFVSLVYLVYAGASLAAGRLSDAAIRAGASASLVRKGVIAAGHLGMAVCLALCAFGDRVTMVASLLAVGVFFGMATPTLYAIAQTLAGPDAGGKWIGLQNGLANLAGIVGPLITGGVVDATGVFDSAFLITAAVAMAGAVVWVWMLPRIAPLDWSAGTVSLRR